MPHGQWRWREQWAIAIEQCLEFFGSSSHAAIEEKIQPFAIPKDRKKEKEVFARRR